MGETTQKRMRFRRVILATTVLASLCVLLAGLALAVWYGRGDSISQSPSLVSAYADVSATVSGQEYVAAVWSEGRTGHAGALKLRWGPPGEKWKWPITMVEYRDSQSQESAVAVSGNTAYIAYIKRSGSNWVIGYAECPYGSSCTKATVHSQTSEMGKVDIAFCNGTRHVVWADATTGADDDIWYSSSTDGSWAGGTQVSTGGTDNTSPSIACYGGTAYVAWIQDDSSVMYANSSNWGTTRTAVWSAGTNTPYNTSIAAYGNYVDVIWDYKDTSNDYWVRQWRKILGGGSCSGGVPDASTYYASTDSDLIDEYVRYLQPAIAVYSDTTKTQPVPAVVWHADIGGNYEVMYSYGIGFGGSPPCVVTWSDPISLTSDFSLFKNDCSAPSVAIGISGMVTRTHVVFQQDVSGGEWEIYYTSEISSTLTQGEPPHNDIYMPIIMKSY